MIGDDGVKVKIYRISKDVPLPKYMSEGASGVDLHAWIEKPITIGPGEYNVIPTGLKLAIPKGYEAQVRPRSGLAANYGVTVLNTPGTVDSDYRGEIKVILINFGNRPFIVEKGMRIAQMVFSKVEHIDFNVVLSDSDLEKTERNEGGFGHTGI